MKKKEIKEAARMISVIRDVDVLVAGGGAAGAIAGLAAARMGSQTIVLERLNCLGGNFTAGLMTLVYSFNDKEKLIVKGIPLEFIGRLAKVNSIIPGDLTKDAVSFYDTEIAKFILADMYSSEPNLEVLFNTWISDVIVEDNMVKGVIIESKSGRQAILAKAIVDATGDADVAARAGAEFMMAPKDRLHPVSLIAKIGNVNVEEMLNYYKEHPSYIGDFPGGGKHSGFFGFKLNEELKDVDLSPELEYLRNWFILYYQTPQPGVIVFNMTGETNIDGTNVEDLTRGEFVSRKRLLQELEVFQKYIPGFKNAYIMTSAQILGVRETRRITGEYILTAEDLLNNTRFPDAVCSYAAPVGIHTPDGKDAKFTQLKSGTSYDIPYRCMIPKTLDGVIVAGRSISVQPDAMGSTRNMTCCMAIGQAAGVAAALSSKNKVMPRAVEISELQKALLNQGVYLEGKSNIK